MCYVCGENHWAQDHPNQNKVKGKQVAAVQAEKGKDKAELPRMGTLRLVNAVCGQPSNEKLCRRELMFIDMTLNGRATRALDVKIAIGSWRGMTNLIVEPLDDFGVILGMDFLASSNVVSMPHMWVLSLMDELAPCMVSMCRGEPMKNQTLTALQLCEKVKCMKAEDLEEEDPSKSETVKS